jgi:dihydroneopterin triphosphate diphosphatase
VEHFRDRSSWDPDLREIPEYGFAVAVTSDRIRLSDEHIEYAWLDFDAALGRLAWDSNRALLRELHDRLTGVGPKVGF